MIMMYPLFLVFSRRSIGSRFILHKHLNQCIQRLVLPLVDLRVATSHSLSIAKLLASSEHLLFRNTKVSELNRVLDLSAHRTADEPSPEVSLDPLETLEGEKIHWSARVKSVSSCQVGRVTLIRSGQSRQAVVSGRSCHVTRVRSIVQATQVRSVVSG